jgi:hypothetical protein
MTKWLLIAAVCASAETIPAPAPAPKPTIYSRADWGAGASGASVEDPVKVRIIVHHTDIAVTDAEKKMNDADGWQASKAQAQSVLYMHTKVNGWDDIGYHYLIDWQGRILEGRPIGLLGAHAESNNPGSIGIVLMGAFQDERPTQAQLDALHDLTAWLTGAYGISPEHIDGHHHFNSTACPGIYLENDADPNNPLRTLRKRLLAEEKVRRTLSIGAAHVNAARLSLPSFLSFP